MGPYAVLRSWRTDKSEIQQQKQQLRWTSDDREIHSSGADSSLDFFPRAVKRNSFPSLVASPGLQLAWFPEIHPYVENTSPLV